ncbi:hypothetical protein HY643_04420 [Candidatus Woesearchaeota archaeon]|nr:hypothetical protein [Candidatus Woesearchaeota archaeon]
MMVKKLFLFMLLFAGLSLFLVSGLTKTFEGLNVNKTAELNGKTLKILRVSPSFDLFVEVDGVNGIVDYGKKESEVNGMIISILTVDYIGPAYADISLELAVPSKCGDGACNLSETKQSCCKDCGCNKDSLCVGNVCVKEECDSISACNDNNSCTIDTCEGSPKKCVYSPITACVNGDWCCPTSCNSKSDSDCEECQKDEDCEDDNPCTINSCFSNKCLSNLTGGCQLNNTCYQLNAVSGEKYCSEKSEWVFRKNLGAKCIQNYECLDNNCSNSLCGGRRIVVETETDLLDSSGLSTTSKILIINVGVILILATYYFVRLRKIEAKEE